MSRFRANLVKALATFAAVSALPLAGAVGQVRQPPTGISFFDNFATFDRSRWFVSNGWANGPEHNCGWSNTNVRRAKNAVTLVLNNRRSANRPYSCGELQTHRLHQFGLFEARMRAASGFGVVSAFFLYTRLPGGGDEQIGISIAGNNPTLALLTHAAFPKGVFRKSIELGFDASTAMADYAFQWEPGVLRWFVNGRLVHEVMGTKTPIPSRPSKIFMNIRSAAGRGEEDWLGTFEYGDQPLLATFEYVAFTELGQACQFPASLLCATGSHPPSGRKP